MDFIIAMLIATFWIWIPVLILVPFIIWSLIEGVWMWFVHDLRWCSLTEEWVTDERWEMNHEMHYGDESD